MRGMGTAASDWHICSTTGRSSFENDNNLKLFELFEAPAADPLKGWHPVDALFFDRLPLVKEKRVLRRVQHADVRGHEAG